MSQHISQKRFYSSAEEDQITGLASLAKNALEFYGLSGADISSLAYRENMTFAIDAGSQGKFALRVHQADYRTDAQVQSELDYMEYLNGEGIRTPELIRTSNDQSFIIANHPDVPEPRQCDLFHWIDGAPLRKLFETPTRSIAETAGYYAEAGKLVAAIYNAGEKWTPPENFERLEWDAEGILGEKGHLGDFRKIKNANDEQRGLLCRLAEKLSEDITAFGKTPDRYGLSQSDLLPENLMVCDDGLRIIDFDDSGYSWVMFDVATAFWDLTGSEYFEPCFGAFVEGFRELRELREEHLAMMPTFTLARMLSYLAHTVSRDHLAVAQEAQQMLLDGLTEAAPGYLASRQ